MPEEKEAMLRTERLDVGYHARAVLRGVELTVRSGEIVTLIGPNGAGKSTLLRTLARQLEPVAGTVYAARQPLRDLPERTLAQTLSVMMTERMQAERMTCRDVVESGRYPYTGRLGLLTRRDRAAVDEAMELVQVTALAQRPFQHISDGQRQRVMLARAICQQPKILLLDEPTSFLDIRHKLELLTLLKELVRVRDLAVVLSLHELDLAQKVSDRLLCIRAGRVDCMGTPEEIFSGDYIHRLYGLEQGSYNGDFGCLELAPPTGAAQVFVIGGGGAGIPTYRHLQRLGIPFAAGVLHENDLEVPVARALAAEVIIEQSFEPIGPDALRRAERAMAACPAVLCCVKRFGTLNTANQSLMEQARARGALLAPERSETWEQLNHLGGNHART